VRCVDHRTGILVAVKIIRNKKRFHQQALVEVNILQKLREWVSYRGAEFHNRKLTPFSRIPITDIAWSALIKASTSGATCVSPLTCSA
jgi:hypothetical protein